MKHQSTSSSTDQQEESELGKKDPLWNLLGKASENEPDVFFTRNVLRATRQLEKPKNWRSLLNHLFSPRRIAIGAAVSCACLLALYQLPQTTPTTSSAPQLDSALSPPTSSDLADLVIMETLNAAAEDPSLFTHDEVVAMIGL